MRLNYYFAKTHLAEIRTFTSTWS